MIMKKHKTIATKSLESIIRNAVRLNHGIIKMPHMPVSALNEATHDANLLNWVLRQAGLPDEKLVLEQKA